MGDLSGAAVVVAVEDRYAAVPDRALTDLRGQSYPVLDDNVARLSAYTRRHINVHGHYSFRLPDLGGAWRPLRDPDQRDPDEQD
ncbi:hypothetical protein AB0F49_32105 [Micromonospora ureilytica]|uniref:hypothetical protein n=1 Tax=Micromonospora ureilytica TaxID=709868 RepID=UPI0033D0B1D9